MADILKITTPLINRNQEVAPKPTIEPTSPFQLHDLSKIIRPTNQRDILPQNNTLMNEADSPEILLDLLKDPGVTVTYLKNIFMLEEIFKLLPQNNATLTKEIEDLYHELLLSHDDIANELIRQEQESTVFRGEFFDFLRSLVNDGETGADLQSSVINLMRSVNNMMIKDDVMDAVANSLTFLAKNLQPSKNLAQKLEILAYRFRQGDAPEQFASLKSEALAVLKEVEESVLFDPKLQKMASITIYNLSRFNDSMDYFHDAAGGLWQKLAGENRALFAKYVNSLMDFFREHEEARNLAAQRATEDPGVLMGARPDMMAEEPLLPESLAEGAVLAGADTLNETDNVMGAYEPLSDRELDEMALIMTGAEAMTAAEDAEDAEGADDEEKANADGDARAASQANQSAARSEAQAARGHGARDRDGVDELGRRSASKVMDALIEMIKKQSDAEEAGKSEAGQVDKILHSLLSSPCNFTPLLHFVVPAYLGDVKAFAELWINPYDDDNGAQGVAAGRRIHILMVVDVEILGRFEVELKVRDRIIDLSLHCPKGLEDRFSGMIADLPMRMRYIDTPYRLGRLEIETLDHSRSLMEVFKTLPYKRMGVDIKV